MGITREAKCPTCGITHTTIGPNNEDKCPKCKKKERIEDKAEWLSERRYDEKNNRPKTLEERVDWIEEWIYDHKDDIEGKGISKYI